MNKRMFQDDEMQATFERDGYVVFPLLNAEEVEQLRALWDEVAPDELSGIYSPYLKTSKETCQHIERTIRPLVHPQLESVLQDHRIVASTFIVKGTGPDSASKMHQDWSSVDENQFASFNIWVPLEDVDEVNGQLLVFPGSHTKFETVRSMTTPSIVLEFEDNIEPYLQTVPLKAGEAVVFAHSLFHGSKPNLTDNVRVSVTLGVLHDEAQYSFYHQSAEKNILDVYNIDENFFFEGLPNLMQQQPIGNTAVIAGQVPKPPPINQADVLAKLNRLREPVAAALTAEPVVTEAPAVAKAIESQVSGSGTAERSLLQRLTAWLSGQ